MSLAAVIIGDNIVFNVSVPFNNYLAIGFGESMAYADIVMWQSRKPATSSDGTITQVGNSSSVLDLTARATGQPGIN